MMAIIIIEGRRGVGKTTMCSELHGKLTSMGIDARLWKSERTDNPTLDMAHSIAEMILEPDVVFILDRFHLTEFVLSAELGRRKLGALINDTFYISRILRNQRALVFLLTAADEDVTLRLSERRQEDRAKSEFDSQADEQAVWLAAFELFGGPHGQIVRIDASGVGRLQRNVDLVVSKALALMPEVFDRKEKT